MRQNRSQLIHLITVILTVLYLFILPLPCHCNIDPKFLSCVPKDCGDGQNISFPFYIDRQQESYCGYPRFDLSCNNKQPNINLFGNNYTIQKIHYNNQSLRVVNSELLEEPDSCFRPTRNLTLYGIRFHFSFDYSSLFLFSNCTPNISSYKAALACSDEEESGRVVAMFEKDPRFGNVSKLCRERAKLPVELDGDEGNYGNGEDWEYYREMLRRGFLLNWTASSCGSCEQSGGHCGFDEKNYKFQCFCPDQPHLSQCSHENKRLELKLGLGIFAAVGIAVVLPMIYCVRKKCILDSALIFKDTKNDKHFDAFLRNFGSDAPKRYSYRDIQKMTNSFREKLGQGGFGGVYKGKLCDGRIVAMKVLNEAKDNIEEFINEVASISRTSHVNVVNLLGFSFEKTKRALIYEFMSNGSLDRFIYDKGLSDSNPLLELKTLYDIAVGIARGLEYLHRGCNTRILHFDIKPHNILLDEDFCPKISDFGLAKLCQRKESIISMLGTRGTVGYIAPEVFSRVFGGVSYKSDVYSYGMMILEMVVGKDNFEAKSSQTSESYFPDWIYKHLEPDTKLRLHRIMTEEEEELTRKMILVGLWCIQTVPSDRPSMTRVVEMLEGSHYSLQIPPKPILCSPPRPQLHSSTMSL